MKKIFVTLFLVGASMAKANNFHLYNQVLETATVNYSLSFSKLVINDNINVILQEGAAKEFIVSGNEQDIDKLLWNIKNGTLSLGLKSGRMSEKITVLITVSKLSDIVLNSNTSITNIGKLTTPLRLQVNHSCNIALSSVQPISIAGAACSEIELKQQRGKIIFEN